MIRPNVACVPRDTKVSGYTDLRLLAQRIDIDLLRALSDLPNDSSCTACVVVILYYDATRCHIDDHVALTVTASCDPVIHVTQ